jgi:hypothetical protein
MKYAKKNKVTRHQAILLELQAFEIPRGGTTKWVFHLCFLSHGSFPFITAAHSIENGVVHRIQIPPNPRDENRIVVAVRCRMRSIVESIPPFHLNSDNVPIPEQPGWCLEPKKESMVSSNTFEYPVEPSSLIFLPKRRSVSQFRKRTTIGSCQKNGYW